MKVLIEKYRGFEIYFDKRSQLFETLVVDESKDSKSYNAVKKFIDDYCRRNVHFEPFTVIRGVTVSGITNNPLKIVGIRKDRGLIAINNDGNKIRVSSYDERNYILSLDENKEALIEIDELKIERKKFTEKIDSKIRCLIDSLTIITLEEKKKEL